jgi:hypothetical protein
MASIQTPASTYMEMLKVRSVRFCVNFHIFYIYEQVNASSRKATVKGTLHKQSSYNIFWFTEGTRKNYYVVYSNSLTFRVII